MLNNIFDTKYLVALRKTFIADFLILFLVIIGGVISHFIRTGEPSFYAITSNSLFIIINNMIIFLLILTIYISIANREI